ncbi:hypothetical protein Nepgr_005013 [Nepenthes gracilis]|uniref:Uncharacterized protein n=1 Tax=Nepenthes gracilis TaxID=150966 RepID=A0AAD3S2W4_NEPGR|nr:hypothetical protein Nepgr_005013 [Nepenthes gracilis]
MEWWRKVMKPLQRAWVSVSTRLGFRKSGLLLLHREVKACEYEDVHIMWEMLKKNETELAQPPAGTKGTPLWNIIGWAIFAPCVVKA